MGRGCTTELGIARVTKTVPGPRLIDYADSVVDPVSIVSSRYGKQQHSGCRNSEKEKPQDDLKMAC